MKITPQLLEEKGFYLCRDLGSELVYKLREIEIVIYPKIGLMFADHMLIEGRLYQITGMSYQSVREYIRLLTGKWIEK